MPLCMHAFSRVQLFATLWTITRQASLSMGILQARILKGVVTSFSSASISSVPQLCPTLHTPWAAAHQASLSITNSRSLFKLMSIELVTPSNHLILCCSLLLPPSIFPSISVFSNESVLHIRCPKYWSFSFNVSTSSKYSGLISFRMDWLDLLAVQGTLKSLIQHHTVPLYPSSKTEAM